MFYVIVAICALVTTFYVCRYYAAKALLVEQDIERAIARKFASSGKAIELANLKEENAVMRNLLLDLLENETSLPTQLPTVSKDDILRIKTDKIQRYREILAESQHVLQRRDASYVVEQFSPSSNTERRL